MLHIHSHPVSDPHPPPFTDQSGKPGVLRHQSRPPSRPSLHRGQRQSAGFEPSQDKAPKPQPVAVHNKYFTEGKHSS